MTAATQPVRIGRRDPERILIDWADGKTTVFTAAELRRLCPCAQCVHELTGQALLDPAKVPDDLTQRDVRLVGNYAIAVQYSALRRSWPTFGKLPSLFCFEIRRSRIFDHWSRSRRLSCSW